MNFIYDILLNFNKNFYEFYDWNREDHIDHIKKIPVFRVSSEDMYIYKNQIIKINDEFLKKLEDRTEVFHNKSSRSLKYACIVCDGKVAYALCFNKDGKREAISSLLLDEEQEVIDFVMMMDTEKFSLEGFEKMECFPFTTRKENFIQHYVQKKMKNLKRNGNKDLLQYIYLECFGVKEESVDEMFTRIQLAALENKNQINEKIYHFFKLISSKNIK